MSDTTEKHASATVIHLAERAEETVSVTELTPANGKFIGKTINADGSVTQYPKITWWHQAVAVVPATIPHLFAYLSEARNRNICLIRGEPANLDRWKTRRQRAHEKERDDHGFVDTPTRLLFLDIDGIKMQWRADLPGAVAKILAELGEPWASTSCVWFLSARHGLERDEHNHWTGRISDDKVRVRLAFLTDRALTWREATALTLITKAKVPALDISFSRVVQPNYIARPRWVGHPDEDPLGDIATIGRIKGRHDALAVPEDLEHEARWAKAQGYDVVIADHPDAVSAICGIGSDGSVRSHLMSAVVHLLINNPVPDVVAYIDHSMAIVAELQAMVEQHRDEILTNLMRCHRSWVDVQGYFPDNMVDWARWCLDHQGVLRRKTIKLIREEVKAEEAATLEEICDRVARAIERASRGERPVKLNPFEEYGYEGIPPVELIAAPTGSRKSTLMRAAAVRYVREHPGKTVVILIPRHELGSEQIDRLMKEHPDYDMGAAIWRGRHADDPDAKPQKMCQRDDEAKEIEDAMLNVDHHLCKQGRGKKQVRCPLFDQCGYQRQKQVAARIWFAAHECLVHEKPKALGKVGWVMIDESPLDAFMFGVDTNDQVTLGLDLLRDPPPPKLNDDEIEVLGNARKALYDVLDKLKVPIDRHRSVPVPYDSLDVDGFDRVKWGWHESVQRMYSLEWKGKITPKIRPNMTKRQVRKELQKAAGNSVVNARATLWQLVGLALNELNEHTAAESRSMRYGRISVQRGTNGRMIRLMGLREIAKGWRVQTLICDATGDAELLKAIWPDLEVEPEPWPQLPRPPSVRVSQIVDRSLSKYAVAVESRLAEGAARDKDLEEKGEKARKLYAALLMKAMEYGGAEVAAIVYKSTEAWIRGNCFVPDWLKLKRHGDVAGSNIFENVRALFEIGRLQPPPEAMVRQAEALFGHAISKRDYVKRKGQIPIVPDAAGNNAIEVTLYKHRDPIVQRLLWRAREGGSIQNSGRARAGLRNAASPLDIHRWTDVPVPELGLVEPMLWDEVDAGPDGLMLASAGIWLRNIPDAAQAFKGLLTARGLKEARDASKNGSGDGLLIIDLLLAERLHYHSGFAILVCHYQRSGRGRRAAQAVSLRPLAETRAWLEDKLGELTWLEVEERRERA